MLRFVLGRANSGKSDYIYDSIAGDILKGSASVILMVPEQGSFENERKLVTRLGASGSSSVEVMTFTRLSELVFEELGEDNRTPMEESGRIIMMCRALDSVRQSLKLYGRQAASPEFISSVITALDELRQSGLLPEDMLALSKQTSSGSLGAMLHDFALIGTAYGELIGRENFDNSDRLSILYDMLGDSDFFKDKKVYFDSFSGFTGQQYKIIDRILAAGCDTTFSFPCDKLEDDDNGLGVFSNVKSACGKISRMAASHGVKTAPPVILDKSYFESPAMTALELAFSGLSTDIYTDSTEDITVISAGNMYDEVSAAARRIHRIVRTRPGCRYKDFAVIARDISKYENYIERIFAKYDIPVFFDSNRKASSLPLMSYIISSVSAAKSFSSEDIFRSLKTGLAGFNSKEISELENYAFVWNVKGEDWLSPFEMDPEGFNDGRTDEEASKEKLLRLNGLRERAVTPLLKLREGLFSERPARLAEEIFAFIKATGADERLKALADRFEEAGDAETAGLYRQSYDEMMKLLSQIHTSFGEAVQPPAKTAELLEIVISSLDLGRISQKLDTVVAGSAEKIRPERPRFVFVLGFNQGSFPSVKSGGLISQTSREKLIELGVDLDDCRLKCSVDENFLLYKTLFACYSQLYISYSRSDNSGHALEPSPALDKILRFVPGCSRQRLDSNISFTLDDIETADGSLDGAAPLWNSGADAVEALKACLLESELSHRAKAMSAVNEPLPDRLSKPAASRLFGKNLLLSASGIDTFNRCHFSYFCRYGLRAKPLRRAELNVMQRGSAVHYVLDGLTRKYGADFKNADADKMHSDVKILLDEYKTSMLSGRELRDGRLDFLMRRLEILLCEIADRLVDEFSAGDFIPQYSELSIGFSDTDMVPPLKIGLQNGSAAIIGAVDRVDTCTYDDRLVFRVIDYKTGHRDFALPDVVHGLNMQMLIYMTAIKRGGIKNVDKPLEAAGILYMPAKRLFSSGAEIDSDALREIRMNGLLKNDDELLTAMNKNRDGKFIPVKYKKDGTPYKTNTLVSAEDMGVIEDYVISAVKSMGDALHEGEIAVSPVDGVDSEACKYCDFKDVCLNENEPEKVSRADNTELIEKLKEALQNGI